MTVKFETMILVSVFFTVILGLVIGLLINIKMSIRSYKKEVSDTRKEIQVLRALIVNEVSDVFKQVKNIIK